MNFNLFKILKGMFTPYVEPTKKDRIDPTINNPIHTDCEYLEFAETLVKREMNEEARINDDGTSPGSGAGQSSSVGIIPHPLGQASPEGENKFNYIISPSEVNLSARRKSKKKRNVSRNRRRMNGNGYSQSHTSHGHDDSGSSYSSASCSSSDSGGGSCGGSCGGGE